jgi:hypothetical protein
LKRKKETKTIHITLLLFLSKSGNMCILGNQNIGLLEKGWCLFERDSWGGNTWKIHESEIEANIIGKLKAKDQFLLV